MASYQEKIENSSFYTKQKLYDNHVRLHGQELSAIRLLTTVDKYEDDINSDILSNNTIVMYADIQNLEIPLNRYRLDQIHQTTDSESIYLFEVIPIDAYIKWTDEVEAGDLLVLVLKDKNDNIDIPIVFRVSDQIGKFQKNLLFKKFSIAPYNPSSIDPDVRQLILNYINDNE